MDGLARQTRKLSDCGGLFLLIMFARKHRAVSSSYRSLVSPSEGFMHYFELSGTISTRLNQHPTADRVSVSGEFACSRYSCTTFEPASNLLTYKTVVVYLKVWSFFYAVLVISVLKPAEPDTIRSHLPEPPTTSTNNKHEVRS